MVEDRSTSLHLLVLMLEITENLISNWYVPHLNSNAITRLQFYGTTVCRLSNKIVEKKWHHSNYTMTGNC